MKCENKKQLLIMRHAKSSWDDESLADHDRPLNSRGKQAALCMGRHLRERGLKVDVVLASTAARVKETLSVMMPQWKCAAEILWIQPLYAAPVNRLLSTIAELQGDWHSIMLVGHNPGLNQLLGHLSNEVQHMPTASIAVLETFSDSWPHALTQLPWRQVAFWKPKDFAN